MRQEDLEKLKQSIRFADYFALIYFIVFLILLMLKIINVEDIIGIIIGYISVKFTYERQVRKYKDTLVEIKSDILINVLIYALAMFIMVSISTSTLLIGTLLLIIYRQIVLTKFKSLLK